MTRLLTVWIVLLVLAATAACGGEEHQEVSQPTPSTAAAHEEDQQASEPAAQQTAGAQTADQESEVEEEERPAVPNQPPIADAGEDVRLVLDVELVQLSGKASFDPDGEQLTYSWEQTYGPEVQLSKDDDSPSDATFAPPSEEGVVAFVLTVTDPHGATDTARVQISFKKTSASGTEPPDGEAARSTSAFSPTITHQPNDTFSTHANDILYKAFSDPDTGTVSTQVSMEGIYGNLTLDLVCAQSQALAGLKMHDPLARLAGHSEGDLVYVGLSGAGNLRSQWMVIYIVDIPTVLLSDAFDGFSQVWQRLLRGGRLTAQVESSPLQGDSFQLDSLVDVPVFLNLVNCGSY